MSGLCPQCTGGRMAEDGARMYCDLMCGYEEPTSPIVHFPSATPSQREAAVRADERAKLAEVRADLAIALDLLRRWYDTHDDPSVPTAELLARHGVPLTYGAHRPKGERS